MIILYHACSLCSLFDLFGLHQYKGLAVLNHAGTYEISSIKLPYVLSYVIVSRPAKASFAANTMTTILIEEVFGFNTTEGYGAGTVDGMHLEAYV